MRTTLLAFLLSAALAACSSNGGGNTNGDACSATQPCGDGSVCDMTDPGGPICIDAVGDLDGDGIPNDKDHCEHMAGGMFDEDGDGIGDECDKCPIAKPPATPDPDGDDVDSPCDPDPRTAGEKIVLFNGFNAPLPNGWTADANWKVVGGEAIMTPADPATAERLTAPLGSATTHTVVFASYRVDSVAGAGNADAAVFGLSNLPMSQMVTADCGGSRTGPDDILRLQTDAGSNQKAFTNLFDPAGVYRVVEQLEGASANCALVANNESGAITTTSTGNLVTQAGLFARGATVRFSYLMVIQR